ncbi:hypothetical protein EU519_01515 [Candidatus Thorarchaeota archaeon]|nr:MAG: hypothetical protein EU519_01515 [Candidatus Thorarchaeota archaeon]
MASVLGGIAKGLIKLITKVQFWIAIILVMAIVIISGQIAILAANAANAPEVGIAIMNYTMMGLFMIAVVAIILIACKYMK